MTTVVQAVHARSTSPVVASITPVTPGNSLLVILGGFTGGATNALSSITDSNGVLTTASAYATITTPNSSKAGIGVYFVQSAAAGAHSITATMSTAISATLLLAELSTAGSMSVDTVSALSTGAGTAMTTASIIPVYDGDFIVAVSSLGNQTGAFSAWLNGFTQGDAYAALSPSAAWGYLNQATHASISSGVTYSLSSQWGMQILSFKTSTPAPTLMGQICL